MRITNAEKLKMVIEHIKDGRSLSHISEKYEKYDTTRIKYYVNLYKKYGEKPFINREDGVYKRDTKLLLINRVKNGESIRAVALDFGLIDPRVLGDWVTLYNKYGENRIQDTYPRKNYLNKDERYKANIDKKLAEENERLKAEIEYLKKSQSLARKLEELTTRDKTKVVNELRTKFDLKVLLEISRMASSVFYYQLNLMKNPNNKYELIEKEIEYLYLNKHKRRAGYQRIYIELKRQGQIIGKNKVLEIMRNKGYSRKKKNTRKYNSYKGEVGIVVENLLNQKFKTIRPFHKAGTDITMFRVKEEAVYLSPIIDFKTREILAYSVGTDAKVQSVLDMLIQLKNNHKKYIKGMIIQSDQGVQYQNSRYSDFLKELGIIQSMSRKGNCLDNSPTENFFGRIKDEIWYGKEYNYETANDLIKEIHDYMKYYNETRIVTRLQMSPIEYRNQLLNMLK